MAHCLPEERSVIESVSGVLIKEMLLLDKIKSQVIVFVAGMLRKHS